MVTVAPLGPWPTERRTTRESAVVPGGEAGVGVVVEDRHLVPAAELGRERIAHLAGLDLVAGDLLGALGRDVVDLDQGAPPLVGGVVGAQIHHAGDDAGLGRAHGDRLEPLVGDRASGALNRGHRDPAHRQERREDDEGDEQDAAALGSRQ
jgi:hypothetical protein